MTNWIPCCPMLCEKLQNRPRKVLLFNPSDMFLEIVVPQECLKMQDCWHRDQAELLKKKRLVWDNQNGKGLNNSMAARAPLFFASLLGNEKQHSLTPAFRVVPELAFVVRPH